MGLKRCRKKLKRPIRSEILQTTRNPERAEFTGWLVVQVSKIYRVSRRLGSTALIFKYHGFPCFNVHPHIHLFILVASCCFNRIFQTYCLCKPWMMTRYWPSFLRAKIPRQLQWPRVCVSCAHIRSAKPNFWRLVGQAIERCCCSITSNAIITLSTRHSLLYCKFFLSILSPHFFRAISSHVNRYDGNLCFILCMSVDLFFLTGDWRDCGRRAASCRNSICGAIRQRNEFGWEIGATRTYTKALENVLLQIQGLGSQGCQWQPQYFGKHEFTDTENHELKSIGNLKGSLGLRAHAIHMSFRISNYCINCSHFCLCTTLVLRVLSLIIIMFLIACVPARCFCNCRSSSHCTVLSFLHVTALC